VAGHSAFYVSKTHNPSQPNSFWSALQTEFHDALVDSVRDIDQVLDDFYVSNRISEHSQDNYEQLIRNLPDDVRSYVRTDQPTLPSSHRHSTNESRLDYYELDLIDFIVNARRNRVLSIIGAVGVGKSTYLHYVLRRLRRDLPTLQAFAPLFIDCLRLGTNDPEVDDLFSLVKHAATAMFHDDLTELPDKALKAEILRQKTDAFTQSTSIGASTSVIIDYIDAISRILGSSYQPVVIFDNVDQLVPHSVEKISHLSRAIFLRTGICTILALRPPTFSIHRASDAQQGAFYSFRIELPPPDLRQVMMRRLSCALQTYSLRVNDPKSGFHIIIHDVKNSMKSVLSKTLTSENQRLLLKGICNNNIRKALKDYLVFLRYRGLSYDLLFDVRPVRVGASGSGATDDIEVEPRKGGWREHLIDGLMMGDRLYYRDDPDKGIDGVTISNILVFDPPEHTPNFIILYRILALLSWAGRIVETSVIVRWLRDAGYDETLIHAALQHLLRRRLVFSPETERRIQQARHICLNLSGEFYLTELINEPQYILNAIYDVPLEHRSWDGDAARDFAPRLESIVELIDRVLAAERDELQRIIQSGSKRANLGSIHQCGFLARRIYDVLGALLRTSEHSTVEAVKQAAVRIREQIRRYDAELSEGEELLNQAMYRNAFLSGEEPKPERFAIDLGQRSELRVQHPSRLEPGLANEVDVELDLSLKHEPDTIFVRVCGSNAHVAIEEMAALKGRAHGHERTYSGSIKLREVKQIADFPPCRITFFADSWPILSRKLEPGVPEA
jgi:hypothetical protein